MLNDKQIARRCGIHLPTLEKLSSYTDESQKLITPFISKLIREDEGRKVISYGLSSFGYDIRVGDKFLLHAPVNQYGSGDIVADPKKADNINYISLTPDDEGRIIIPPHGFVLCHSVETINMSRDLLAVCIGKSTYARLGLVVNVTPLEPEWSGQITIEISNTTPTPVAVYPNEGIAQLIFYSNPYDCLMSYKDRDGKYQNQEGVTIARV